MTSRNGIWTSTSTSGSGKVSASASGSKGSKGGRNGRILIRMSTQMQIQLLLLFITILLVQGLVLVVSVSSPTCSCSTTCTSSRSTSTTSGTSSSSCGSNSVQGQVQRSIAFGYLRQQPHKHKQQQQQVHTRSHRSFALPHLNLHCQSQSQSHLLVPKPSTSSWFQSNPSKSTTTTTQLHLFQGQCQRRHCHHSHGNQQQEKESITSQSRNPLSYPKTRIKTRNISTSTLTSQLNNNDSTNANTNTPTHPQSNINWDTFIFHRKLRTISVQSSFLLLLFFSPILGQLFTSTFSSNAVTPMSTGISTATKSSTATATAITNSHSILSKAMLISTDNTVNTKPLSTQKLLSLLKTNTNTNTDPIIVTSTTQTAATSSSDSDSSAISLPTFKISTDIDTDNVITGDKNIALIDEVYELVDKYYLDKSKIHSTWDGTRDKYRQIMIKRLNGIENENTAIRIVSDMVRTLDDKYSRVLDPKQYSAIQKYDLIGVGVSLMPDPANKDQIIVGSPPVPGTSADKAQLHQNDIITAINGIPTKGKTAFDIIEQISDNPNAPTITMTVVQQQSQQQQQSEQDIVSRDVTMERTFLEVKDPISYRVSERRVDGTIVGYIQIKEFNSLVKGSFIRAIQDLSKQGSNAYVIDLRQNTGGAFQSAIELSSIFLTQPSVSSSSFFNSNSVSNNNPIATYVVDNTNIRTPLKTKSSILSPSVTSLETDDTTENASNPSSVSTTIAIDPSVPVVVWVDSRTASASEVLASALHDNCRAVVIGSEKSFGKGLIQAVYGLQNYNAGLVLTVARYETPAGNPIQGVGINPDILLPATSSSSSSSSIPLFGTIVPSIISGTGIRDTSIINFNDVQSRLSSQMCTMPTQASTK